MFENWCKKRVGSRGNEVARCHLLGNPPQRKMYVLVWHVMDHLKSSTLPANGNSRSFSGRWPPPSPAPTKLKKVWPSLLTPTPFAMNSLLLVTLNFWDDPFGGWVDGRAGRSPTFQDPDTPLFGLTGTRGFASVIEQILSFKTNPCLSRSVK